MKKQLCFFFLIIFFQGFSQDYYIKEINFLDYETKKNLGKEITIEVTDEKKIILNLKRPNLRTSHFYSSSSWNISPRSYESVELSKTFGSFNLNNPRLKEENIIFTIKNNKGTDSSTRYVFLLKNKTSNNQKENNTELIINVVQPNLCDKEITYEGKVINNEKINLGGSIFFNNSIINSSDIVSNNISIKNTRILPNSTISSRPCKGGKRNRVVENLMFVASGIERKVSKSQLNISPNPTSGQVEVNSEIEINNWYVYDVNAKIVLSGNNTNYFRISLYTLPAGIYYFKFIDLSGVLHERTVIKK